MNAYVNQYQNNQILNASPEQILIMLYDGAIRFCRQAMHAMDANNRVVQAEKVNRTIAIVSEFANTLDHEVGGHFAEDLDALYGYMIRELTNANVKNDRKCLETVAALLEDLRETWVEAIEINRVDTLQTESSDASAKHVAASF